jgi:hypothetical protein
MKHHWQLHRTLLPVPAHRHRWDQAYQALLRWTLPAPRDPSPCVTVPSSTHKEVSHACRDLYPRFDQQSGPTTDH